MIYQNFDETIFDDLQGLEAREEFHVLRTKIGDSVSLSNGFWRAPIEGGQPVIAASLDQAKLWVATNKNADFIYKIVRRIVILGEQDMVVIE